MVQLKRILVPTDLSAHSLAALEYVSTSGFLYASRLFVLYVAEHGGAKAQDEAEAALKDFIARHVDPAVHLTPVARVGHAVQEIRRFSQKVCRRQRRHAARLQREYGAGAVGLRAADADAIFTYPDHCELFTVARVTQPSEIAEPSSFQLLK